MTTTLLSRLSIVAVAVCVTAAPALAQQTSGGGHLEISEVNSGWVAAPEVTFTRINDRSATLAGGYVGYDVDHTLLIGGAAYGLTNRDRNFEMQYGGAVVRWTLGGDQPIAFTVGGLVGGGSATLTRSYADLFGNSPPPFARGVGNVYGAAGVRVRDDFFVAEPKVGVLVRLAPWMRLDLGASYRAIGGSRLLEDQLRGASGSIAVRIGSR